MRTEVAIIGAGPVGLELAAALRRAGKNVVQIDRGPIGASITRWPRNTRFFSAPERVAIAGYPLHSPDQQPVTGEMYLAYLRGLVEALGLEVKTYEEVERIRKCTDGFRIHTRSLTGAAEYAADRVVLATGDMADHERLNIPGEDLPHVKAQLDLPHLYFQQRLLIVGGKNSALESALRCFRAGARVSISYRGKEFDSSTVRPGLLPEVEMLIEKGMIEYFPQTAPTSIAPGSVELARVCNGVPSATERRTVPADFVMPCIGYRADRRLFEQLGVALAGRERRPVYCEETMETEVEGVYVAGTAANGDGGRFELFIETSHVHVERIVRALGGAEAPKTGSTPERNYDFELGDNHPPELRDS